MKLDRKILVQIACVTVLAACGGGSGTEVPISDLVPEPTPPPPVGVLGDGRLGELVEWARSTHGLPAMAVVIVHDGRIVEMAAEGRRSAAAAVSVTTSDRWHLGSLTKGLTSSLAAALVEMSVLNWDTRPLDVWPELDMTIDSQLRDITLRQLLSHTAGLRRVNSVPSRFGDLAPGTVVEKRREFAAELLAESPAETIGQFSYSNGGYIVAGAMMETLMSASWEMLLQDYVFSPLSIVDAGFGAPGNAGALDQPLGHWDRGTSYEPVSPGLDADNPQVFGPSATVNMTMHDYAQFMLAHIAGARGVDGFLTASSFDTLHTPVTNGPALGWGVGQSELEPGAIELVHDGSNLRWYAIVRLVPALNAGALFVVNAGGDLANAAIDALDDLVAQRFEDSQP